jgi:hypothetical protein
MAGAPVPLSELVRDLPEPVGGWAAELERRFIAVVEDDLGRPAIDRVAARALYTGHYQAEAAAAAKRVEVERRLVEADQARAAAIPKGIPLDAVPPGVSPAQWMMLNDAERQQAKRESVLQHALANGGSVVYHPIGGAS